MNLQYLRIAGNLRRLISGSTGSQPGKHYVFGFLAQADCRGVSLGLVLAVASTRGLGPAQWPEIVVFLDRKRPQPGHLLGRWAGASARGECRGGSNPSRQPEHSSA